MRQKTIFWLLALVAIFYFWGLGKTPVHLNQDEMVNSINAHALSRTLRDTNGRILPFYIEGLDRLWYTPMAIYFAAPFLRFLPLTEATIRIPSVLVGLVSIFLLAFLVDKLFRNRKIGIISGFLMATTPALFINSRIMIDNIYLIPFILLWLIALQQKKYFWAGFSLGVGFHAYHAAVILSPLYFGVTLFYLLVRSDFKRKNFSNLFAGFTIPILVFVVWLMKYPATLTIPISYANQFGGGVNFDVASVAARFLSYFNPKLLFVTGDGSLIHSTGQVGAFLFPVAFWLTFGLLQVVFKEKDKFSWLALFGFLTFPLASALVDQPQRISRSLIVIPFVALLSAYGMKFLYNQKDKVFRFLIYFLLVFSALQFLVFIADYFGDYRRRSYYWFNQDTVGAFTQAIKIMQERSAERLYLDRDIKFAEGYFEWTATKLGQNLAPQFFDSQTQDFREFDPGSVVVTQKRVDPDEFELVNMTAEPDGSTSFYVYYRNQ